MKLTKISVWDKVQSLFRHGLSYVLMKIFSRIFFFKRVFIFFNRLRRGSDSGFEQVDDTDGVRLCGAASVDEVVADLNRDGYCKKLSLSEKCLQDIVTFSNNTACYAYGDPKWGFKLEEKEQCQKKLQKDILLAKFYNFQSEEPFAELIDSSLLQSIACKYLGKGAKNIATQLWWTFPAEVDDATRSSAAHFFHRDVDAWGFVKFFFYLTDVYQGGGPHIYVRGSHQPTLVDQLVKEQFRIRRHADSVVRKRFGSESVEAMYGPAGSGIAADTFGFHKGESPEIVPRLMLCSVYGTKDYGVQNFKIDPRQLAHYSR